MIDPKKLKERQGEILRLIKNGGGDEISKLLAILSLVAEKTLYECEVNRKSIDFVGIPIAKEIFDGSALLSEVKLSADAPLPRDSGFHDLEHDPRGVPFRWTGPSKDFSFEFGMDRSDSRLALISMLKSGRINGSYLERIRVFVDGRPVPCSFSLGRMPSIEFEIPKRNSSMASTTISVECDVWSPSQEDGSEDQRTLGIPFVELSIGPLV